jgi:hypothetical protein
MASFLTGANILEEKGPFLGEEEGKPRQIDLPVVNLGFAKVSIKGRRPFKTGSQAIKNVPTRLPDQCA